MALQYIRLALQVILINSAFSSRICGRKTESQQLSDRERKVSVLEYEKPTNLATNAQDGGINGVTRLVTEEKESPDHDIASIKLNVAFSAYLSQNLNCLKPDEIVVFDQVLLNDGNAYDQTSGVFTVPISGVYSFTYYIGSRGENQAFIVLKLGDTEISEAAVETNFVWDDGQGGNTSIFHASIGQKVTVRFKEGSGHIQGYSTYRITTFSGQLLYVR